MKKRKLIHMTIVAAVIAAIGLAPSPASAWEQYWDSSNDYRASYDFVPNASSLTPAGKGCGGGLADHYQIKLVKTSGSSVVWISGDREVDSSNWHTHSPVNVSSGTSYYMRWQGWTYVNYWFQFENPAPCQGLRANW